MGLGLEEQRRLVLETADRLTEARKLYAQGLAALQSENYQEAAKCIARAAGMRDSTAQCQLGFLFEIGFFGEADTAEAARWYPQSAEQCLPQGHFRLRACD